MYRISQGGKVFRVTGGKPVIPKMGAPVDVDIVDVDKFGRVSTRSGTVRASDVEGAGKKVVKLVRQEDVERLSRLGQVDELLRERRKKTGPLVQADLEKK